MEIAVALLYYGHVAILYFVQKLGHGSCTHDGNPNSGEGGGV